MCISCYILLNIVANSFIYYKPLYILIVVIALDIYYHKKYKKGVKKCKESILIIGQTLQNTVNTSFARHIIPKVHHMSLPKRSIIYAIILKVS